jgi:hypothetical protein
MRFINDANTNTVRTCTVSGVNTSTSSGVIFFSNTTGTTGNDNNLITDCDLRDGATTPTNIIYSSGSTSTTAVGNSNVTISNNRIYNYFSAGSASGGVKLSSGSTDWIISGNKFYQTSTITQTSGTQHSAVWIDNTSGNNFLIQNNTIGYASASGTGTYTFVGVSSSVVVPIYLNVGSTTATQVMGNTIAGFALSGSSSGTTTGAPFRGIYIAEGLATTGNSAATGNTIGSLTSTGSITYTSSSTSSSEVIGIFNFSSYAWIASFNSIGGISVSNSSTGAAILTGIRINTLSSVPSTFQSNVIGGSAANSMISNTTATGSQVFGIFLTTSNSTVTNNTIRNLTASGGTGTTTGASVVGLVFSNSSVNNTVTANTISQLSNTNTTDATTVTGIQYTASSGTNVVERNFIYGLSVASSSSSAEINGIRIAGGTTTYRNNMVALGASVGVAAPINGIIEASGTNNILHNSVYIDGNVASGSGNSFAFNSSVTSNTRSYRDNIFMNARANSGASGKNYVVQVGGTAPSPSGLTINNNIYYSTGSGAMFGRFNATDVVDIPAWRTAVGGDAVSVQSNPQFTAATAATPNLHIHPSNPSPAEGNGVDLGVINDFDADVRSSNTPVDIGADAGNFVALDVFAPSITYTTLSSTSCTTGRLASAIVTDKSGINSTTGTRPRIYYKKSGDANAFAGNTSSDNGWKFVEASNTASPFNFSLDYSILRSAVTAADVIQYFVVAQDLATTPNVAVNSATFAANPSSVALSAAAFPVGGSINSFTILSITGLTGTVTIGAAGTYTSLTGASGLFNAINNAGLSGNLTATIIDASVTESGAIALNAMTNNSCSAGQYSLTIKPQATLSVTLTGSSTAPLIKLNGADNVTIDGSNNGTSSRDLTITNTNTGTSSGVIWLASTAAGDGATGNVIKNCIITGNASTTTFAGIMSSGSVYGGLAEGANTGNKYQNNAISLSSYGIAVVGPTAMESGTAISNNDIGTATNAIGFRSLFVSNQNAAQITGNTIQNLVTSGSPAAAVLLAGTTDAVNISGNTISNINSSASSSGLSSISAISQTASTQTNTIINGNTITGIVSTTTGGWGVRGIIIQGSGTTLSNNILSDIYNYQDASVSLYGTLGITIDGAVSNVRIYNNSVNLFGSHPGFSSNSTGVSAALYVNSSTTGGLDVRNNIFSNSYNNSTSSGDKAYAIYSLSANTVFSNINNNDYYVSGSGSPVLGYLGSDVTTLSALQTAFGGNANSISYAPTFISNTNLHLDNSLGLNWCLNGTGATIASVTTDIDAQTRSTPPDIGADEFVPGDNTTVTPATQTICSGSSTTTIATGGSATSIAWTRDNTSTVTGIGASGTGNVSSTALTNTTYAPVTVTFSMMPATSGCPLGVAIPATVVVNPVPNATGTPSSQISCTGSPITTIAISSLVPGTTFSWSRNNTSVVTGIAASGTGNSISGTLTNTVSVSVPIQFTITPTFTNSGLTCTGTAYIDTVTVNLQNTAVLSSAAGTDAQSLCINSAITTITYATTGATGATVTGLPAGVTGSWVSNVLTISGAPTVSGTFNYTVNATGGAGCTGTSTGVITVQPVNSASLSSAVGTDAQTTCVSTAITSITYATVGATGATVSGLPSGVTGTWASNVVTISGTPGTAGTYPYTVTLTGGCGTTTVSGNITVTTANSINLTSAASTTTQAVCINTAITNITYATIGATGATVTGLPAGVTGTWVSNVVTITGTPTASGSFGYTVTLVGGCGAVLTASGTVTVSPNRTIALTSAAATTSQSLCINTAIINITYATTGVNAATVTGLPAGVTGTWAADVFTISGTPTVSGTFNYTVTPTSPCGTATATGTITVNPNTTVTLTSAAGTNNPTLCANTALTNITFSTTGATGATFSGLPAGVTGAWASNVITISGTPTASGTFGYTVTLTGGAGCGGTVTTTGTITVNPTNTITLTSGAGSNTQTLCINTAISTITFATTSATGANFSGLPSGVSGSFASNVVTISGTPTVGGNFNYTVTLTGGCGNVTAVGAINVNIPNTIALISSSASTSQSLCVNTQMTNISYATSGATGATFSGLPSGVSGSWASNQVIISGIPAVAGTYSYTVTLTGGSTCGGTVTSSGSITVRPANIITLTSAGSTIAQTPCINTAITSITYATTNATGATFSGLPSGVTGSWSSNVATISGTPTASGTFNYTVTLTGGCGNITATGSITVLPNNTVSLSSAAGTNAQTVCVNTGITSITYATTSATGATVTGLPAGVTGTWSANVLTISGTPTASGTFNYTATLTGGCGNVTTTGSITVITNNTMTLTSAAGTNAQTRCLNTAIANITYGTAGGTGVSSSGLPSGVTASMSGNIVTVSGTPTATGTFNYTLTLTGGCGTASVNGTINVNPLPTITVTPGTAAICIGSSIALKASGGVSYTWSPSTGLSRTTGDTVTAGPGISTTYTINGTDGNGCVGSTTKLVTVNGLPTITVFPSTPITICEGLTTALTASGAVSYSWSPASSLNTSTGGSVVASPKVTTTYTVTGTNSNGCVNTTTKTINVLAAPDATITPSGQVDVCQDDTVYFTAAPGYVSYVWLLYGGTYQTGTSNKSSTIVGGLYTLKVTDASGCVATTATPTVITVTQKPVPTIVMVAGHLETVGGGFTAFQWYKNGAIISGATNPQYTPTSGGSYTVRVVDNTPLHCAGMSIPYIHTGVGVNGTSVAVDIRLYPNPTNDIVHIDAPVSVNVVVNSMEGKMLYSGKEVRQIDLSAFPDGVYRVLITSKSGEILRTDKITKMTSK